VSQAVAWSILPLFITGIAAKAWLERRMGLTVGDPVGEALLIAGFGAFAVVGALLVARRPGNPVSWIMASIGLMVALFPAAEAYAAYVMTTRGQPNALAVIGAWINAWYWPLLLALSLVYLPLLFPDGQLPSTRWWPLAVIPGLGALAYAGLGALVEELTGQNVNYTIINPIGIQGLAQVETLPTFSLIGVAMLVGLVAGPSAVIVRLRRSRGPERQQLKWFLYAAALLPLLAFTEFLAAVGDVIFGLILIALPAAIGVAILRYRLYDIDLIIRRTLIYSLLTVTLALVYFGSVALLQGLFTAVGGRQSAVVVVVSTLAIAALFAPVRRRVQAFIDRRFYRRRYDAADILAEFGASARDETDLDRLSGRLVAVVEAAIQPAHVGLWLNTGSKAETAQKGGNR
jgi:hypothetical protein